MQVLSRCFHFIVFTIAFFTGVSCKETGGKGVEVPRKDTIVAPIAETPFEAISADTMIVTSRLIVLDSSKTMASFSGSVKPYAIDSFSIVTFRGGNRRDNATVGTVSGVPVGLEQDWMFTTRTDAIHGGSSGWGGGSGWTGQPLLVRWSREMKVKLGITNPTFLANPKAVEVIIGSLSGDIYFLDLETGIPTRNHLTIDGPIKGTVSVDPRLNGILYVGQGIGKGKRFGAYIIDMVKRQVAFYQPGIDGDADRSWGAFDSNPLVDVEHGRVIWPGENGLIYTFDVTSPEKPFVVSKLKYIHPGMKRLGLEAGMAAIGDYGFFGDNSGNILCVQLSTMKPIWRIDNYDDTDASIVVSKEKDQYYLYVGNEVDHRQPTAVSSLRKLEAGTGKEVWRAGYSCAGSLLWGKENSGGMLATPVVGKQKGAHLVFGVFSRINQTTSAKLIAIHKETGKEVYSFALDGYSWATPVDFYDQKGNMYLFLSDVFGNIYLLNGLTGKLLYKGKSGFNMESSPVVIGDRIVVGSRGKQIQCFKIKTN